MDMLRSGCVELHSDLNARNYFNEECDRYENMGWHKMKMKWENVDHFIQDSSIHDQPNSHLNESVMGFLKCILDRYLLPGIPQRQQIDSASQVLSNISFAIRNGRFINMYDIIVLSNKFYQMIPHAGRNHLNDIRRNCRPPLENSDLLYGKEVYILLISSFLYALQQGIQAANLNPLDYVYNQYFSVNLMPIATNTYEYCQFLKNFGVDRIHRLFKVEKTEWTENFRNDIGNHHYLFHSTHLANAVGILKDGLQIAPIHVFSYNRWAGKGIYFYGSIAAINAYARKLNHKIVLVCRVALGNTQIIERCPFNTDPNFVYPLGTGLHSIKQLGTEESCFHFSQANSANLPIATRFLYGPWGKWECYDEFIVQNANQVKIEYIIELSDFEPTCFRAMNRI